MGGPWGCWSGGGVVHKPLAQTARGWEGSDLGRAVTWPLQMPLAGWWPPRCCRHRQPPVLAVGVNTCDIITLYISAIKALRVLDPSMVILEVACEPVRRYLR